MKALSSLDSPSSPGWAVCLKLVLYPQGEQGEDGKAEGPPGPPGDRVRLLTPPGLCEVSGSVQASCLRAGADEQ
jgi:hypothetical protein